MHEVDVDGDGACDDDGDWDAGDHDHVDADCGVLVNECVGVRARECAACVICMIRLQTF